MPIETASVEPAAAAAPGAFAEAVRMGRWDEARTLLDALPDAIKSRPEIKLLRARVALVHGDGQAALVLLDGLEQLLPLRADDLERWRADARFLSGAYLEAARYYAKQPGLKANVRAAIAFEKAGAADDAQKAADRALRLAKGDRDQAPVRGVRARLAESAGQKQAAIDDARWIAVNAPHGDQGKEAEAALERLDPSHPLTGSERLRRAEKWADAGRVDDALAELDRAASAPSPPKADELAFARANTLYRSRSRYAEAATAFDRVAKKKGPHRAESMFYAARSRSRADDDDEALRGYRAVVRQFPGTSWADEGSYLAARLSFLHGRWVEAADAYRVYLKTFANGKERTSAVYERAVALLAGRHASARTELAKLAAEAQPAFETARLRELQGVAEAQAGHRKAGVDLWNDVIKTAPLSWPALMARARLVAEGAEPPLLIEPSDGKTSDPIEPKLPEAAALYHRLGLDGDAEEFLKAGEREAAAQVPGREKEALCTLYGKLSVATRLYRVGLDAVSSSVLMRAPSPATKWAWDCVYPRPYAEIVTQLTQREKLPPGLLHGIMRQESAFDPEAVSGAKAVGLLQLMPDTARKVAQEASTPFDETLLASPPVNLDLGARYLAKMLETFQGSVPLAVAAYNAGPVAVARWLKRTHELPADIFAAFIPYEETRTYLARVVTNVARYAYLDGGETAVAAVPLKLPAGVEIAADAF